MSFKFSCGAYNKGGFNNKYMYHVGLWLTHSNWIAQNLLKIFNVILNQTNLGKSTKPTLKTSAS